MKNSNLVYSTDVGRIRSKESSLSTNAQSANIITLKLDTKSRKGKVVTVASGFNLAQIEIKSVMRQLKKKCSTGGTVKNNSIELQGNFIEFVKSELTRQNFNIKIIN
ncbi:stress response translation initiation inhibitor YciH [Gammaproteobacteria bacterium]|nr:stress response translation initiation inhibitor YciH [Gammaproteobacteria bacterium]